MSRVSVPASNWSKEIAPSGVGVPMMLTTATWVPGTSAAPFMASVVNSSKVISSFASLSAR